MIKSSMFLLVGLLGIIAVFSTMANHSDLTRDEVNDKLFESFSNSNNPSLMLWVHVNLIIPMSYIGYAIPITWVWISLVWIIIGISFIEPIRLLSSYLIALIYFIYKGTLLLVGKASGKSE